MCGKSGNCGLKSGKVEKSGKLWLKSVKKWYKIQLRKFLKFSCKLDSIKLSIIQI